jgi:RimJ/RimL family protein N-acetyltransferase
MAGMGFLATPRLTIRRFVQADLDAVVRLLDVCFGEAPHATRVDWLEWSVRNYEALAALHQPPFGDYAVTLHESGELIGSVGLEPSFGPFDQLPTFCARLKSEPTALFRPELGLFWAIAPDHRRRGYASEAAAAVARFAFDQLHAERLVATTEHDNSASIAVMRRIGMTVERNPDLEPTWFQTVGILFNPEFDHSAPSAAVVLMP